MVEESPNDPPFEELSERGMLTETDRMYLLGKKTYDDATMERRRRLAIRDRVQGGLRDFWFLLYRLSERDREQIVVELPDNYASSPNLREEETRALVDAVAFLSVLSDDLNLNFELVIEQGLKKAQEVVYSRPAAFTEVAVSIDWRSNINTDDIVASIEHDTPISWLEYVAIWQLVAEDVDEFLEATQHIELPDPEELPPDEHLPLGKSFVYFARVGSDFQESIEPPNKELLHPKLAATIP